jgi:hypothetical protein
MILPKSWNDWWVVSVLAVHIIRAKFRKIGATENFEFVIYAATKNSRYILLQAIEFISILQWFIVFGVFVL